MRNVNSKNYSFIILNVSFHANNDKEPATKCYYASRCSNVRIEIITVRILLARQCIMNNKETFDLLRSQPSIRASACEVNRYF